MPPKRGSKRKAASPNGTANGRDPKQSRSQRSTSPTYDHSRPEERSGVVMREFYPTEMSNERCAAYDAGEIPRPLEVLETAISETADARTAIQPGDAVVHWFKRDLRTRDNTALHRAAALAAQHAIPLVALYVLSPQDHRAHYTSAVKLDFELRSLAVLRRELDALDVPLCAVTVDTRADVESVIVERCRGWGARHVFCNIEYEVDELRREARLTRRCAEAGIDFAALHDTCVVAPETLVTGTGKQYSVYTPWFRAWLRHVHAHPDLLQALPAPSQNPAGTRDTFADLFADAALPSAPKDLALNEEEKARFAKLWPAGEHEALERLERFLTQKIGRYADRRNFPADDATAKISVHLSAGTLAARTAVRMARDRNSTKKLDGGVNGIANWISEVAWRDFYKHVLAHWPYVCMYKPWKYVYTNIDWEYSDEHFAAWREGKTGFPIVDAAMRQLSYSGYMHNRCRMIVASFLSKDLLLDWRLGEQHFMRSLVDGDFASNNGGWGFSASTGVDPQPYFRIFNPLLQSERFDPAGAYIRKWLPELAAVEGKAVHDPYGRGAETEATRAGYPRPIVEHKQARERALARYKGATA